MKFRDIIESKKQDIDKDSMKLFEYKDKDKDLSGGRIVYFNGKYTDFKFLSTLGDFRLYTYKDRIYFSTSALRDINLYIATTEENVSSSLVIKGINNKEFAYEKVLKGDLVDIYAVFTDKFANKIK